MNKTWWKEASVYQIYPKSFCDSNNDGIGDLQGIISKLKYIKSLGVDIVWLSPIYASPDRDNGYDISDYRAIQPAYGTMKDFDELLMKTHQLGMKLVMDLVVNHTSDRHPWYLKAKSDINSKYHNYYYWRKKPNNWKAYFGGSAWTKSEETGEYSLGVFSPFQPDLNWSNPMLREEIYSMMRVWLDKGIDGFRLDAIHCIGKDISLADSPDSSPIVNDPVVHKYLSEMNKKVLSHYDIMTVGEASGLTPEDMCSYAGQDNKELNMMIQFSHVDMDQNEHGKWNTNRPDLTEMKKLFNYWQTQLYGKSWLSLYWSNHDQPRSVSRLGNTSPEFRERSAAMIAVNTFLMCGTPFVFQGEEIGMTNNKWSDVSQLRDLESINAYHEYVDSGIMSKEEMLDCISAKGRDNARTPMQWTNGDNADFTKKTPWIEPNENYKKINVEEQENRSNSLLNFYRSLLRFRKENETVLYGSYEGLDLDNDKVFAYKRKLGQEQLIVICNFTKDNVCFEWKKYCGEEKFKAVIGNYAKTDYVSTNILQPYEAVVIKNEV